MNKKCFAFVFILLLAVTFLSMTYLLLNIIYPLKYISIIKTYCNEFNVEEDLVLSMIKAESNFDVNAISYVGAVGLMQLMPATASFIAEKIGFHNDEINLYDAETNILLGVAYISYLQNKFENQDALICAYNAGEGEVATWLNERGELKEIKFEETQNYLNKVKQAKIVYKEKLKYL